MSAALTMIETTPVIAESFSQLSDEELVLKSRAGADAAFSQLARRYRDGLYRLARRLAGDDETALECVQEAFTAVYANLRRWPAGGNFRAWLFTITLNKCRSELRRRRLWKFVGLSDDNAGQAASPEAESTGRELARQLQSALRKMPRKRRECTILKLESDLSTAEIAQAVGVSPGGARVLIHRGLADLREAVRRYEGEP